MGLLELMEQADEWECAVSGVACLERCVSLAGGGDEVLRPLWGNLSPGADPQQWGALVEAVRAEFGPVSEDDPGALLVRQMLDAAPDARTGADVRVWADCCSLAALRVHRLLDPSARDDTAADPRGDAELPPLVDAELRRQVTVLEAIAGHAASGLRRALDVSAEGRRVVQAVVSRRERVA